MEENQNLNVKQNSMEEPKDKVDYISYSHTDNNGVFREAIGFHVKNEAEEFFSNLSDEELAEIKRR